MSATQKGFRGVHMFMNVSIPTHQSPELLFRMTLGLQSQGRQCFSCNNSPGETETLPSGGNQNLPEMKRQSQLLASWLRSSPDTWAQRDSSTRGINEHCSLLTSHSQLCTTYSKFHFSPPAQALGDINHYYPSSWVLHRKYLYLKKKKTSSWEW